MLRRLALLPALVLLAGCPSFSTMGTARTLPKGKGQLFVAPGGMVLRDFQQDSNGQYESFGLPTVEVGGRYGVADGVEVGGSLGYAWTVGDGFRILPEVSVAYPARVSVGGTTDTSLVPEGAIIQGSIGLLFGGE